MKVFKQCVCALLSLSIVISLTGCHGKDETALTINGVTIQSALYLSALLECDSEARQRVDSEAAEAQKDTTSSSATSSEKTNYYSKTLDGMKYTEYVKSKAIKRCKEFAFYETLLKDKKISLTDEEKSEASSYADYYWSQQGTAIYEPNGIGQDTYKLAFLYSYYANAYFKSIYAEGGTKEVSKADISKTMLEKYALVYTLSTPYTEETTDADKTAAKAKLDAYAERLKKGESFEKIYTEFNGSAKEDPTDATNAPKDKYATVVGDEDAGNSASADFEAISKMKLKECQVIENASSGVNLYMKLDIASDSYYLKNLTDSILYHLKQEEFDKSVEDLTAKYSIKENKFAINRLSVKKIKYPESTQAAAQ